MKLSIVIVNYRGWKRLRSCLESLRLISNINLSFEVIVVDNQSNDNQLELFSKEFNEFTFIENSGNNGFANGCNVGAEAAKGEYLLFLNPDTVVNGKAITTLIEIAEQHPEIYILSCQQVNERGKPTKPYGFFPRLVTLTGFLRAVFKLFHSGFPIVQLTKAEKVIFPDWVSGSVILISKNRFLEIGKWNEDYWMYYEDVDLCKQAKQHGGSVALLLDTTIEHNHGGSSRINIETKALTKTETVISKHVYINNYFNGLYEFTLHAILIIENTIQAILFSVISIISLFAIQKINLYRKIYWSTLKYYLQAINNQSWLSIRSKKSQPDNTPVGPQ